MGEPGRKPGRPRDSRLDKALLEAGLAVFLESGYSGAYLVEHVSEPEPIPDTGSIRDDLVAFMKLRLRTWARPLFRKVILPTLMEGNREGAVASDIGERFAEYRKALVARIGRSIGAGELRPGTNPGRLVDLLMGTIALPLLFFQEPPAVDEADMIVDQVLS